MKRAIYHTDEIAPKAGVTTLKVGNPIPLTGRFMSEKDTCLNTFENYDLIVQTI